MATQAIADWATALSFDALPPAVVHAAVRTFYNWVGCVVGGSSHPATTTAHKALWRFFGGAPTSSLLGGGGGGGSSSKKVDAQHAALLNGIASHVHDYDDTHLDTIIHPAGPVAAALLAIAETLDSAVAGTDFVVALVAGIEVECKAGLAVWPNHYDVGWHITSTTGSLGAAVAVSKLLRLTAGQTAHAIGIAATQVTGLREMFGSHTKSFHAGRAAQNGLLAAVLASEGFTSSTAALEARRGWVQVVGNDNSCQQQQQQQQQQQKLRELVASLGQPGRWEIEKNAFKPFPCGIVVHPVIDGCIALHGRLAAELGITAGTPAAAAATGSLARHVAAVQVTVHPLVLELTGKKTPADGLEAKFSVYHGGAVALLFGKATPAQYEDAVVVDPLVVELRDKFRAVADGAVRPDECHVAVDLMARDEAQPSQATRIELHVDAAVGSVNCPMTDTQLSDKFLDQCSPLLGAERASAASAWCWALHAQPDVRQIGDLL